ncbi:MAG: CHASE2 domain-containing protein [Cytophagaceae bacterium]
MKRKNRKLFSDSIYATSFVVGLLYLLSFIPLDFEILNPIENVIGDFRLTDLVFSHMRENPKEEERITIVNIGGSRAEIAAQLEIINKYEPKVVGIDAFFRLPKDPIGDSLLAEALAGTKNLVLVSELIEDKEEDLVVDHLKSHPMFLKNAHLGFADMITEGDDNFKTSREFSPYENFGDKEIPFFAVKVAELYDPMAIEKLHSRGNDVEVINYQGNIDTRKGVSSNAKTVFTALDLDDLFEERFVPEVFKDKIVLMGYLGNYIGHNTWEDKFFTPLNQNYIGKANPDMYGVVIHANIISMILQGEYINDMPDWLNWLLGIIVVYINVWFCCFTFLRMKELYEGVVLVVAFAQILPLLYLVLRVFEHFHYTFNITFPIIAIVLAGNLVEVYYGILKVIYNRIERKIDKKYIHLQKNKKPHVYEN